MIRNLFKDSASSLWLWPSIAVAVAFIVGALMSSTVIGEWAFAEPLFFGGANGGRQVLTALVGGLVTALSVIFSLTITGLQLVHQKYSPRLLRNFMQDKGTKVTLSIFAGTVAYMLAVLRNIPAENTNDPVPRLAILGGMALFLACVGAVAYFAQHITDSVRVMSAMDRVSRDTQKAIDYTQGLGDATRGSHDALPELPETSTVILSTQEGYLQNLDVEALLSLAEEHGISLRLRPMLGDQLISGTPLAWAWQRTAEGRPLLENLLEQSINEAITVKRERSLKTDVAYGFRQLVDVAVKAVSPSENDPYTAVQAIDHLTVLLTRLAKEGTAQFVHRGAKDEILLAAPSPELATYVALCCDQIRRYGGQEPAVAVRLIKMLRDVGLSAPEEMMPFFRQQIERLLEHAESNATKTDDVEPLRSEAKTALAWLSRELRAEETTFVRL